LDPDPYELARKFYYMVRLVGDLFHAATGGAMKQPIDVPDVIGAPSLEEQTAIRAVEALEEGSKKATRVASTARPAGRGSILKPLARVGRSQLSQAGRILPLVAYLAFFIPDKALADEMEDKCLRAEIRCNGRPKRDESNSDPAAAALGEAMFGPVEVKEVLTTTPKP